MEKLPKQFYLDTALNIAPKLLGCYLVTEDGQGKRIGKIVETEAYMGTEDKAAHSSSGVRTPRTEVMYQTGGNAYIYLIYGMYHCLNVVCNQADVPQAVLIRALEPVSGLEKMAMDRFGKPLTEIKDWRTLTNGPGKLCKAMGIARTDNGASFIGSRLYLLGSKEDPGEIVTTTRIGVDYAQEAKDYPYRFYLKNNPFVSKK